MIVETKRLKPIAFQPFEITISVMNKEEYIALSNLFSYYQTIPSVVYSEFNEKYKNMQDLCMQINDALDEENQ